MPTFQPQLEISVDETTGKIRAAYIRVRNGSVHETREVADGRAFADYSEEGLLLGLEVLGPCEVAVFERLAQAEPEPVGRFLRGSPPRELVTA
jgi:hypothetical protein